MKKRWLAIALCLTFAGCKKQASDPKVQTRAISNPAKADTTTLPQSSKTDENHDGDIQNQYVFLNNVDLKDGKWLATTDYIQFLTGEKALNEAKKRNLAEVEINEKGEKEYFLTNDYIILNDNPKLRELEIAPDAEIFSYNFKDGSSIDLKAPKTHIQALKETLEKDYPYTINIKNGKITEIRQIFIP